MARPAPTSTPGPAATTAPRSISAATCRSDPPLARSMASSPSRRATIILAASRITAAPTTNRLTNRSSSTVSTAAWVPRNSARSCSSGEVTGSAFAPGASAPVSAGAVVVARFNAWYRPCAWSASTRLTSSGYSHCSSSPAPPNTCWIAASWSGSAMTPPTQYGGRAWRLLHQRRPHDGRVLPPEGRAAARCPHDGGDEEGGRAERGGQRQAAARVQPEPRGRRGGGRHGHRAGRNLPARVRAGHQPRVAGERVTVADLQLRRRPGPGAGRRAGRDA